MFAPVEGLILECIPANYFTGLALQPLHQQDTEGRQPQATAGNLLHEDRAQRRSTSNQEGATTQELENPCLKKKN